MTRLSEGWEAARCEPGETPSDWFPAQVPGTAAGALRAAGLPAGDLDASDWWFRLRFATEPAEREGEVLLALEGVATLADVSLNGTPLLTSDSMFHEHAIDVGALLAAENELTICCHAIAPLLAEPRKPRARWRTRVADGNLRFIRTALLGRAPGFAPQPAPVGPWRPVSLRQRRDVSVDRLGWSPRLEGNDGILSVDVRLRSVGAPLPDRVEVECAGRRTVLRVEAGVAHGELVVPGVERWWPHTHGAPVLHDVTVQAAGCELGGGRVGFRTLEPGAEFDVELDPLQLTVNGVPLFARGAVWTPPDPVGLAPDEELLRAALTQVCTAGFNLLRVPGVSSYETDLFYDLCDELGLLVWQDFMFANFDYPTDSGLLESVEREARGILARTAWRPSLAVLCGNSEVEQQVAMLGLEPALGRPALFGALLPRWAREAGANVPYVPSAPSGGDLPFRPNRGVANYFGVGGYRRGFDDVRRAAVQFASECLAIANLPDGEPDGFVPRDVGADWDFADVRDHYLRLLYQVDPEALRAEDRPRYLALSRMTSGEVMAEVLGEWRRPLSPCHGAIVLWLRDLEPGAGWGIVDAAGRPKVAYHHVRRVLAPTAVWTTDEGLGGIEVHVANDGPTPLRARLRVDLYRDSEHRIDGAVEELELGAHTVVTMNVEGMIGRFVDAAYAYRFGPPGHDLVVATLEQPERGGDLLSQAFRFPAGRPIGTETSEQLGLHGELDADGVLHLSAARLVHGVRIESTGSVPSDDAFSIAPGGARAIRLDPVPRGRVGVTALNLEGAWSPS